MDRALFVLPFRMDPIRGVRKWVGGAVLLSVPASAIVEGWLWARAGARLVELGIAPDASSDTVTTYAVGAYVGLLVVMTCTTLLLDDKQWLSFLPWILCVVVWALPGLWALLGLIRWAWMNPLF